MKSLFALLFSVWSLAAATYYVDPVNGSNANDGLATNTAWQTIWYAVKRGTYPNYVYLSAGDTVYLRGGYYRGNTNSIALQATAPESSGTTNNPITIMAYPGETPIVCDTTPPYSGVMLYEKGYWRFHGITYSNCYTSMFFSGVTNFVVTDCTFGWTPEVGFGYSGVSFYGTYATNASQYNIVSNCLFEQWGRVSNDGFGYCNDEGASLSFGNESADPPCFYNLVISNRFIYSAHDSFNLITAYNVIRGNLFVNAPWFPTNETCFMLSRGGNPDEPNYYGGYGNRHTKPGDAGDFKIDMRNVFEYNTFLYTGPPPDDAGSFGIELATAYSIYRYNTVAYSLSSGIRFTSNSGTSHAKSNVVYNCVVYGNGQAANYGPWVAAPERHGFYSHNLLSTNNYIVNNIVSGNYPSNFSVWTYQYQVVRTNWNADWAGFTDPLFYGTNGIQNLVVPTDWYRCYNETNVPDFRLQDGSPCIDAGTWLAFVTSESGSGTTMAVDNSLYFSDGNRIVTGDTIQLQGQTSTAIVSSNDWQNNVLYLASPLTWTNGQGVSLQYNGAAPDMGAYEYGSGPGRRVMGSGTYGVGTY